MLGRNKEEKVKVAVFGQDLRVELKKYPLSEAGNKINIVGSGAGYFMPKIGPTHFLDWPKNKRFLIVGKRRYERIFFSLKKAEMCVDFGVDPATIYGPDVEQKKLANLNFLAQRVGRDSNPATPWYMWAILIFSLLTFILMLAKG
jgi:hypothetical protein